jgi:hypothetical protein
MRIASVPRTGLCEKLPNLGNAVVFTVHCAISDHTRASMLARLGVGTHWAH